MLFPKAAMDSVLGAQLPFEGCFLSSLLYPGRKALLQDSSQKCPMPQSPYLQGPESTQIELWKVAGSMMQRQFAGREKKEAVGVSMKQGATACSVGEGLMQALTR